VTGAGPEPRDDEPPRAAPVQRVPVFHVFQEIYRRALEASAHGSPAPSCAGAPPNGRTS
jgi:hypothetical protein